MAGVQGDVSGTISLNYQRSYEDGGTAGKMETLCPTTGKTVLKCINGYIGAPLEVQKDLIGVELRYIASDKMPIPFGVDPSFTYDAKSSVYGFSVPLYVFVDKSKNLTGGIRFDWTSDKHQSVIGIFASSAFCILPGAAACGSTATGSGKSGG